MKIHRSREPDLDIPRLDLLTLLFDSEHCLAKEDTKIHVEAANPNNFITKRQARDLTKQVAYVLRNRYGIGSKGPGKDAVLVVSTGSPFLPVFFYGVLAAGGIFSSTSTAYQTGEVARQAEDAGATLIVCSEDCKERAVQTARQRSIPLNRVLIIDSATPNQRRLVSVADGEDVLQSANGKQLDWPRFTEQDDLDNVTACLLYSSGTTGLPKGVKIANRGLVASLICTMHVARKYQARAKEEGRDFRFDTVAHLPIAHIAGIDMYSTNPFYNGGTTYWMKAYNFDEFIETHRKYRPAFQFSVPPIWLQIAKSDRVTDHFDGLQVATTGSAPIGYETAQFCKAKLGKGKAYMTQTYGTTETTGSICAQDYHIHDATWSVGDLCPNTTARLLDENDQDVTDGQPGELLIGGPILAQGYHNRPDANRDTFVDGWYRTGDMAVIKDNLVYIVDRKKELIKVNALQVAPAELEALLTSHPRIADAAVIGVWNQERETEAPRAYVVQRPTPDGDPNEAPLTTQQVADFVKQNLASHKQLRGGVIFVPEIPKSASGKILRKELRQRAQAEPKAKL